MLRKIVREKLREYSLTNVWLINQLDKKGIITEKSEFSAILSGVRHGNKPEEVLKHSLEILNEYEKNFECR